MHRHDAVPAPRRATTPQSPPGLTTLFNAAVASQKKQKKGGGGGGPEAEGAAEKQYAAGLAENYARVQTVETWRGELKRSMLDGVAPSVVRAAPEARRRGLVDAEQLSATVDVIVSTHRVWLGTGGE